jgi:hypothetical protein
MEAGPKQGSNTAIYDLSPGKGVRFPIPTACEVELVMGEDRKITLYVHLSDTIGTSAPLTPSAEQGWLQ